MIRTHELRHLHLSRHNPYKWDYTHKFIQNRSTPLKAGGYISFLQNFFVNITKPLRRKYVFIHVLRVGYYYCECIIPFLERPVLGIIKQHK